MSPPFGSVSWQVFCDAFEYHFGLQGIKGAEKEYAPALEMLEFIYLMAKVNHKHKHFPAPRARGPDWVGVVIWRRIPSVGVQSCQHKLHNT